MSGGPGTFASPFIAVCCCCYDNNIKMARKAEKKQKENPPVGCTGEGKR